MPGRCRHLRPAGRCLRCTGVPNITSADDPRLVPVPSRRGRQCLLHHLAAIAFLNLSDAWVADTGRSGLVLGSGHRPHKWHSREHYEIVLLEKYGPRVRKKNPRATDEQIIDYGDNLLAYHSLHETGCAGDLWCFGLAPVSRTIPQQRKTELHAWLDRHAEEHGWVRYPPEPWHLEFWLTVEAHAALDDLPV